MPKIFLTFVVIGVLLAMPSGDCRGDEPPARPTIGLCLAGGGARGGAHIGVLKVLEEMRIPVDYVAGTSIGSIVGGLYASGMAPDEMDEVLSGVDWVSLFNDSPPRKFRSFRRKEEDHLPYLDFEVGLGRNGLKLPAGFVAGPKLLYLLRTLTLPTVGIDEFDDLPIPFRAVASDIGDGSLAVIDHGTVADAMRASMAIPGAFTPHVIDGRTLVDGGFLRNVPFDVVKDMGADIVIVVDVGPTLQVLDEDPSMVGLLDQTLMMTIVTNARESLGQMDDGDVLMVPDLEGIGVESFDRMGETVARGVTVAEASREQLRKLSVSDQEYEAWQSRVRSGYVQRPIPVGSIRVEGSQRVDSQRISRQIHSQPTEDLDLDLLAQDLSRIVRLGEFELVDFSLEPGADPSAMDLVFKTKDKRWGPNYLRMGAAMAGHVDGRAYFALFFYHRMAAINRLGAEWRNQITVGDRLSLDSEFYQPLTMGGLFFVAPRFSGAMTKRDRWLTADLSDLVTEQHLLGNFDIGLNLSHWGEFRLGAYAGQFWGSAENSPGDFNDPLGGWESRLTFDQLDNVDFPTAGWFFSASGRLSREGLGAGTEYDRLSGTLRGAVTAGRTTFLGGLEGGTSFQTSLPYHDRFELGGFMRLSGYERGRLFGDELALVNLGINVRVAQLNPAIGNNIYVGVRGELGQAWLVEQDPDFNDLMPGGTILVGAETLLGPFFVAYGLAEGGQQSFYVTLGRIAR